MLDKEVKERVGWLTNSIYFGQTINYIWHLTVSESRKATELLNYNIPKNKKKTVFVVLFFFFVPLVDKVNKRNRSNARSIL